MPINLTDTGHADYPHNPGTLYDCPACEGECFCAEVRYGQDLTGVPEAELPVCVHHAIEREGN